MSITLPLTLIEGSMALPSLSPLCRLLPSPFGRDWALLPPRQTLRAELKALYAAMLRTFCLNAETIRSICQWEASQKPSAGSSGSTSRVSSPPAFDPPVDESLRTSAEAAPFLQVSAPAVMAAPRGGSMHWGAFTGGVCALGGAAMLAWIAFGHPAHRHTISDVRAEDKISVRQETPLAKRDSPDAAVIAHASADNRAASLAPSAASLPVGVASAPGSALASVPAAVPAPVPASPEILPNALATVPLRDRTASHATEIVTPVKATPARAAAGKKSSRRHGDRMGDRQDHRQNKQRKGVASLHERSGRSSPATIATRLPDMSPMNDDVPQIAVPAITHRTLPKPSSAGAYSPLAPSLLGTDGYASMTTSASTHLRNIAPPSRPASSINPSGIGETEWVNHMSQRRVIEVPDQFTK